MVASFFLKFELIDVGKIILYLFDWLGLCAGGKALLIIGDICSLVRNVELEMLYPIMTINFYGLTHVFGLIQSYTQSV